MRSAVLALLLFACSSPRSELVTDASPDTSSGDASSFEASGETDGTGDTASGDSETGDAPPWAPSTVQLEPIAESAVAQKTPPTWNAHLPKLVGDASFLYAVHTSFSEDVASRYAAVMRRARAGGAWTEVARFSYVHQPPGVVMDGAGTLHLVFDCLRPGSADVTCLTGGAGTAGRISRFYHLAFSTRDAAGALRFDTYANWNEWTAESNGYHGISLLDDGGVAWALADTSWNRIIQWRRADGTSGTLPALSRPSTYLLYPMLFGSGAKLGMFAGEFDPKGGTNAGYPAATLFAGDLTGLSERIALTPTTTVTAGAIGAYPSDVEEAPDGTVYALTYRLDGPRCTELLRFDGGLAAAPVRSWVGCLETYAKLQLARDGRLFLLTSGDTTGMRLGVSADKGATFDFTPLPFAAPLGAGDTRVIGATPVKRRSAPLLHDPDEMLFFAAGMDAANTAKRSYLGRIRLAP